MLIDELDLGLLLISEHWQSVEKLKMCQLQTMYLVSSFCRAESKRHGGVAIYGANKSNWRYKNITILSELSVVNDIECCGV